MKTPIEYAREIKDALQRIEDERRNIECLEHELANSLDIKKGDIVDSRWAKYGKCYVHYIDVWILEDKIVFSALTSDILKSGKVGKIKNRCAISELLPSINLKDV
jgi:hypothetical protein